MCPSERGCPWSRDPCPAHPDNTGPTAEDIARERFTAMLERSLPDAAAPARAIRRATGGRPALVHLTAVRAITRAPGPAGGRRFERQPGATLCWADGADRATRETEPAPGAAVTCAGCADVAGRYGILYPGGSSGRYQDDAAAAARAAERAAGQTAARAAEHAAAAAARVPSQRAVKEERIRQYVQLSETEPTLNVRDLATALNISTVTIAAYRRELRLRQDLSLPAPVTQGDNDGGGHGW